MNTKQLSLSLVILLASFTVEAQNISLQCTYKEDYVMHLDKGRKMKQDKWILDIQNQQSAFYSENFRVYRYIKDSLRARGFGLYEIIDACKDVVKSIQGLSVYRNYPEKGQSIVTDHILGHYYKYSAPMQHPQWTLKSAQKKILDYTCQQAETTFRGRHWTVWYTPEIPIQEGPWKLSGLPGLILEAQDSNDYFHYQCIGIKETTPHPITIPKKKFAKISRTKLLSEQWVFRTNTTHYQKTRLGWKVAGSWDANGKPIKGEKKPIFIERIDNTWY